MGQLQIEMARPKSKDKEITWYVPILVEAEQLVKMWIL